MCSSDQWTDAPGAGRLSGAAPVLRGLSFASSAQFWRLSASFALYLRGRLYGMHVGTIGSGIVPKVLAQHRAEQLVGSIPYVLAVGTELQFGRTVGASNFQEAPPLGQPAMVR